MSHFKWAGNIDWLYKMDRFWCEFCETMHDATNHIEDMETPPPERSGIPMVREYLDDG